MTYTDLLYTATKPGRYLGCEVNQVIKSDAQVRFALAFPDIYEIGMSHAGIKILYDILNSIEGVWAQRVFAPWHDMAEAMEKEGVELFSLEEHAPLRSFDILGFSLLYELSYSSVLRMLKLAGIPLRSEQRSDADPIIIAGGPCTGNPTPVMPFFDLIIVGDGEEVLKEMGEIALKIKGRQERIEAFSQIEGVLCPADPKPVKRRILSDLDSYPFPVNPVMPNTGIVHDRLGVEVARGCTRGCRFCQAGMIYRPYRERSAQEVLKTFKEGLSATGYDELAMLSLSITDLSYLQELMQSLNCPSREISLSVPSMRVEGLTEEFASYIAKVKKAGFTMAPEAATERLRAVINKGNSEEDLLRSVETTKQLGWKLLKLYFMIGLPTETEEDVKAIADLSRKVSRNFRGRINVAISAFNPKAHTPFQWERQLSMDEHREKLNFLRGQLRDRFISLKWQDPKLTFLEGIFARGDERLADVIERAAEKGAYLDGWDETFRFENWLEAFDECGIDPAEYHRERSLEEALPWEIVDSRIKKEWLIQERNKAYEASQTADCRYENCSGCGSCAGEIKNHFSEETEMEPLFKEWENHELLHYTVRFTRLGNLRFISPRDWTETIKRAVRRAELPAFYSQGFSPSMKMTLSPPLAFGLASEDEYLQLTLKEALEAQEIIERLNRALPAGAAVLECRRGKLNQPAAYEFKFLKPVELNIPDDATIEKKTKKGFSELKLADFVDCHDSGFIRIKFVDGRTLSPLAICEKFASKPVDAADIIKVNTIFGG